MHRRPVVVGGSLMLALLLAGGAITLALPSGHSPAQHMAAGFRPDVGLAGPLGPFAFSAVPSYFKRVTFVTNQLGQFQDINAHLPAGKYLVNVQALDGPFSVGPDCMGVAFPLEPSVADDGNFTGYVSVEHSGDPTTVACYEQAATSKSTATYVLFYIPIRAKTAAATPEEHS